MALVVLLFKEEQLPCCDVLAGLSGLMVPIDTLEQVLHVEPKNMDLKVSSLAEKLRGAQCLSSSHHTCRLAMCVVSVKPSPLPRWVAASASVCMACIDFKQQEALRG